MLMNECFQQDCVLFRHHQRDMAVGTHKISGISLETGMLGCIIPGKGVECEARVPAGGFEILSRFAVDVKLPIEGSQWDEVVSGARWKPRQPVPTMHLACLSLTQRAIGVMNADLRDKPKDGMAAQGKAGCDADKKRSDDSPRQFPLESFRHHRCESAIGGRNKRTRERDALQLVAVENRLSGAVLQHLRQLPAEIDRIADSGVHALAAGGAVNMARIAEQKSAAYAEAVSNPVVDAIRRKPVDLFYSYVEERFDVRPHILKRDVGTLRQFRRNESDQALHAAQAHRKHE